MSWKVTIQKEYGQTGCTEEQVGLLTEKDAAKWASTKCWELLNATPRPIQLTITIKEEACSHDEALRRAELVAARGYLAAVEDTPANVDDIDTMCAFRVLDDLRRKLARCGKCGREF